MGGGGLGVQGHAKLSASLSCVSLYPPKTKTEEKKVLYLECEKYFVERSLRSALIRIVGLGVHLLPLLSSPLAVTGPGPDD